MLNICLALLPVLLLLCGLLLMDSFKLLQPSSLAVALAWGAGGRADEPAPARVAARATSASS